ncbi:MAG TPA: glutathione S-transferase family protein [Pseudomonadales bacterium]
MSVFLHHYPPSLFSEKIRLLLGYLGVPWNSVIIPSIMPRPLLMPLSGGYRRTPVLQIGANVFCDTRVIVPGLVRHSGNRTLLQRGFTAQRVADWADTHLFQVTVALNFSPAALAATMGRLPAHEVEAFRKDRAELSQGASITSFTPEAAAAYARAHLTELDRSLGGAFLFGDAPSVADFSLYHCLWFLRNNPVNGALLDRYPAVLAWMARMESFGHGQVTESSGEAALAAARDATPVLPELENDLPEGFALGQPVTVTPVDYGKIPVAGRLAAWSPDEVIIERETPETGPLLVHFPSPGFEVAAA